MIIDRSTAVGHQCDYVSLWQIKCAIGVQFDRRWLDLNRGITLQMRNTILFQVIIFLFWVATLKRYKQREKSLPWFDSIHWGYWCDFQNIFILVEKNYIINHLSYCANTKRSHNDKVQLEWVKPKPVQRLWRNSNPSLYYCLLIA